MTGFVRLLDEEYPSIQNTTVFQGIWKTYERVVIKSLVTTFGLDFLIHDQEGGDVDTVKGVQETGVFKNPMYLDHYNERGKYDSQAYHSDPAYRKITAEARKQFNQTGETIPDSYVPGKGLYFNKGVGSWNRAALDHVISANEIHNDPVRFLSNIDGTSLANDPQNLRYTNMALNGKKSDMSMSDFIRWANDNPQKVKWDGIKGATIPSEVEKQLIAEDVRARKHYEKIISDSYYRSTQFYSDCVEAASKCGVKMGLRQTVGLVFLEIWVSCREEMNNIDAGKEFGDCINAIKNGITTGITNTLAKYKDLFDQFGQGYISGLLANLSTTLCNVFIVTKGEMACYIRQIYACITQACSVFFFNPDGLLLGDRIKATTLILGSGSSVIIGMKTGSLISSITTGLPASVSQYVERFISILVSGLLSCSLLIMLDRCKFINAMISRMNQYLTLEQNIAINMKALETIAADLENFDLEEFSKECNVYYGISSIICQSMTEEDRTKALLSICKDLSIRKPWEGDFDEFMSNRSNRLIFE